MEHAGFFTDGKRAVRHDVGVAFGDISVTVTARDGAALAEWPAADLILIDEPVPDWEVILSCKSQPEARLTLNDKQAVAALKSHGAFLWDGIRGKKRRRAWQFGAAAAVLALIIAFLPQLSAGLAPLVPFGLEKAWGDRLVMQIETAGFFGSGGFCEGEEGQAALDHLLARLTPGLANGEQYRVHVMKSDMVNAFALPGGHVVFLSALIDKGDAGIAAGVLAHEVGHVSERHVAQGLIRDMGLSLVSLMLTGDSNSFIGFAHQMTLGLSYSRDAERQADGVGRRLLEEAGIGAEGMRRFFEGLAKEEGGTTDSPFADILSTHPSHGERVETLSDTTALSPAMTEAEWKAVQSMCGD